MLTFSYYPLLLMFILPISEMQKTDEKNSHEIHVLCTEGAYSIAESLATTFKSNPKSYFQLDFTHRVEGIKRISEGKSDIFFLDGDIRAKGDQRSEEYKKISSMQIGTECLVFVKSKENDWLDFLSISELKSIWQKGKDGDRLFFWSDVRSEWPPTKIRLVASFPQSEDFLFLSTLVSDHRMGVRSDFTSFSDSSLEVLLPSVTRNKGSLGLVSWNIYARIRDKVKIVPIKIEKTSVFPTTNAIREGAYALMCRPILVIVNKENPKLALIKEFVEFIISSQLRENGDRFLALSHEEGRQSRQKLSALVKGPITGR